MLMKRLLLLLLLGICCSYSIGYAQPYPVTTGIVVTSHSAYLDQYAQPNNTIVTLLSTDSRSVYNARMRVIISGQGFTLKTKTTYQPGPIYLYKDQPLVLTGLNLAPYFDINNLDMEGLSYSELLNSGGRLPDGPISICVEVYDYYRENEPPVSNTACSYGTVQAFLPPIIVNPIGPQDLTTPQNILLSWQSQHFGAFPVQYTVEIYRDNLGFSPDVTIANSAPLFSAVTTLQTYNYTTIDPLLTAGEDYLIRVRAEDMLGATAFENEGWSEIQSFTMGGTTAMLAHAVDCYEINESLCIGHCSMTYSSLIMSDGTTYNANINFSGASSGLEVWLNGLNVGDFTVTETAQAPNAFGNCQVDLVISGLIPVNQAVKPQDFEINSEFNNSCSTGQPDPVPFTTSTFKFSLCGQTEPNCLPPANASVSSLTASSMTVDWDTPGGATVDFFSVSLTEEGGFDALLYPVNPPSSSLELDNLQPNTNYTVSICTHCTDGSAPQCVTLDQITTPGDQPSADCFRLEESFCLGDCAAFYPQFHTTNKTYTPNQGFWGSPSGLENYLNSLDIGIYTVTEVKTPNNQWGYCGMDLTITAIVPHSQLEKPVGLTIDAKFGESCTTGVPDNVTSSLKTFDFASCEGVESEPDCAPPIEPTVANITSEAIDLNWGIPTGANIFIKGFQVKHRLAGSGDEFSSVNVGPTTQNYALTGLNGEESYEIEICTECDAGLIECKNLGAVATHPLASCPAPASLQENGITATSIALQWAAADDLDLPNISGYEVRYRLAGSTDPYEVAALSKTSETYTLSGLQDQTTYEIEVCTNCVENGPACSAIGPLTTGDPASCEVPKTLSLEDSTPSSLTVRWTNDNTLGLDEIEVSIKASGSSTALQTQAISATATSYTFSGLNADQSYEISVCFYCENDAIACSALTAATLPNEEVLCPPIAAPNVVGATESSITLSWSLPDEVNSILVAYRKVGTPSFNPAISLSATEHVFEPLEAETEYEFKLFYYCDGEEIATLIKTQTAGGCPSVAFESFVVAELGDYYARLSWEKQLEAEGYEIRYRELDIGAWIIDEIAADEALPYYLGGDLTPGLVYEAQIRTICANEVPSTWTESLIWSTACSKPTIAWVPSHDNRWAIFQWYLMPFSNYYELEYREKGKADWITASSSEERVLVENLAPETTYEYRLRMKCNSGAWSAYSDTYEFSTLKDCDPPAGNILVSNVTTHSAELNLPYSGQAEKYQVRYRELGAEIWATAVLDANTHTLNDLFSSTTYELMLSYDCGGNWSDWGGGTQFTTLCQAPGVVTAEDITAFSAQLKAGSVKAALGIEFSYRRVGDNAWITVPNTAATSVVIDGLLDLTTYEVRARTQCNGTGWSDFSDTYLFTTLVDCQPLTTITEVARTTSSISISWDAHPRANKWKVFIQDAFTASSIDFPPEDGVPIPGDGGDGWSFVTVTDPNHTFTNLVEGNPYRFKVQSWCDGFGWTGDSPEITIHTRPICYSVSTSWVTDITDYNAVVHWSTFPGIDEWHLEFRAVNSNDWWAVYAGITNSQVTLWSLQAGQTYEYRIKARCDDFGWTEFSDIFYFTTEECLAPTAIVEEPLSSSSILLSWTPSEGNNTYLIEYRLQATEGAAWTTVSTSESFVELTGLQAEKVYEYRIGEDCLGGTVLYSPMDEFLLERESLDNEFYECGVNTEPPNLDHLIPLRDLLQGDVVTSGDFQVTIGEVSGWGGTFSGTGYIQVPYFNLAQVNVKFSNIVVNDEYVVISGAISITGIGVPILGEDAIAILDNILTVLESADDLLEHAKDLINSVEELIATVGAYLPEDIINQLNAAKHALEAAITSGDEAAILAAQQQLEQANEVYKEALEAFLEATLDALRLALQMLEQEYQTLQDVLTSDFNGSTTDLEAYIQGIEDQLFGGSVEEVAPEDEINLDIEVQESVSFSSLSEEVLAEDFYQKSSTYIDHGRLYRLWLLLKDLNSELQSNDDLTNLIDLVRLEEVDLLDIIAQGLSTNSTAEQMANEIKSKLIDKIDLILIKANGY